MGKRRGSLPVIISGDTRTGILTAQNPLGGQDVYIVGLKKSANKENGELFSVQDVEWVKGVLHFSDTRSVRTVADILNQMAERWEREEQSEQDNNTGSA